MRAATTTATEPPNWDFVPFDVACARCGHDLRGQSEPKCPACDLTFDWSEAVPIESLTCLHCDYHLYGLTETRCPECGQRFTWDEVLAGYHRRRHPMFEYQWRERPVYSYFHGLIQTLRLRRFWARFDIHDPPAVRPLLVMSVVSLMIAGVSFGTTVAMSVLVMMLMWGGRAIRSVEIGSALSFGAKSAIQLGAVVGLWSLASLAALMIFRDSMKRFKVSTGHVVRVWAYAVPHILPLTGAWGLGVSAAVLICLAVDPAASNWLFPLLDLSPMVYGAIVLLSGIHVLCSIRHGYGTYLRMWHGWGIAIASQVIAVLATATIIVILATL